jgi:exosortase
MSITSDAQRRQRDLPNAPDPESDAVPRSSAIVGMILIAAVIIVANLSTVTHLVGRWSREPDYSHGFLVPLISGFLLWQRRGLMPSGAQPTRGRWLGVVLLAGSALLRLWAIYSDFILMEAVAFVVCLAGAVLLIGGFPALRWAWPSILFLFFMIPLPGAIAGRLSGPLQRLATVSSTYVLQTLGVPAIATGNVIWLSHGTIGVVEACNGLRMLMMFGAATTAAVLVLKIPNWQKICLLVSAPGIAVASNIFRIAVTGLAQEFAGQHLADTIFHDLAGWIMMPLAMLLLALEVVLLSKLFPKVHERAPVVARRTVRTAKAR